MIMGGHHLGTLDMHGMISLQWTSKKQGIWTWNGLAGSVQDPVVNSCEHCNECDVMLSSLVVVYWSFGGTYCFHLQDWRVSQASNQKKEQACIAYLCTSETLVHFCQSAQQHTQEESILCTQSCKNLKSNAEMNVCVPQKELDFFHRLLKVLPAPWN